MQGLYQWQIAGHDIAEVINQMSGRDEYADADREYFRGLIKDVARRRDELDELIDRYAERPVDQIDPVERALLWCGLVEITDRLDVPTSVAINEAVELAKRFGGTDGYKYVNAVLDAAGRAG